MLSPKTAEPPKAEKPSAKVRTNAVRAPHASEGTEMQGMREHVAVQSKSCLPVRSSRCGAQPGRTPRCLPALVRVLAVVSWIKTDG